MCASKHYKINKEKLKVIKRRYIKGVRSRLDIKYNEWKELISYTTKPLTEDEWLQTCKHFNGCAMCGSHHVETRQFFVQFQHGGKYTVCNVFPACSECARLTRKVENPFAWMDNRIGNMAQILPKFTLERRKALVDYLRTKAEEGKAKSEQ